MGSRTTVPEENCPANLKTNPKPTPTLNRGGGGGGGVGTFLEGQLSGYQIRVNKRH